MSPEQYENYLGEVADGFDPEIMDDEPLTYDENRYLDRLKSEQEQGEYLDDPGLSYEIAPDSHLFDSYED